MVGDHAPVSANKVRISWPSRSLVCWMSRNGSHRYTGYTACRLPPRLLDIVGASVIVRMLLS
ncbi:MAG: hypothetical protein AUI14_12545 [Actinobacteria bacterium 13_2_20CM_2_71_6]|nr:MAG: hypothetical protein AUI14_12545 [Actinobacteria bacterium 13_2_20CM_2_71_6]